MIRWLVSQISKLYFLQRQNVNYRLNLRLCHKKVQGKLLKIVDRHRKTAIKTSSEMDEQRLGIEEQRHGKG